jgi:hypothetical protein
VLLVALPALTLAFQHFRTETQVGKSGLELFELDWKHWKTRTGGRIFLIALSEKVKFLVLVVHRPSRKHRTGLGTRHWYPDPVYVCHHVDPEPELSLFRVNRIQTSPQHEVSIGEADQTTGPFGGRIVSDDLFDPDIGTAAHGPVDDFELIEVFEELISGGAALGQSAFSSKEVDVVA